MKVANFSTVHATRGVCTSVASTTAMLVLLATVGREQGSEGVTLKYVTTLGVLLGIVCTSSSMARVP